MGFGERRQDQPTSQVVDCRVVVRRCGRVAHRTNQAVGDFDIDAPTVGQPTVVEQSVPPQENVTTGPLLAGSNAMKNCMLTRSDSPEVMGTSWY